MSSADTPYVYRLDFEPDLNCFSIEYIVIVVNTNSKINMIFLMKCNECKLLRDVFHLAYYAMRPSMFNSRSLMTMRCVPVSLCSFFCDYTFSRVTHQAADIIYISGDCCAHQASHLACRLICYLGGCLMWVAITPWSHQT